MVTDRRIRPADGQDEEPAYRIPPQNLEAEQGLLGALMLDNRALEKVSDFLRPFHFFIPVHQRVVSVDGVHGCERFHVQNIKSRPLIRR